MEIASGRGAHIVCKKAVPLCGGTSQTIFRKEGYQEKAGSFQRQHAAFIAPQFCTSVDRPPAGGGWIHEIKFDGYRIQMRVEDGNVTLKTRKGLDWTGQIWRDRDGRPRTPRLHR